ncbi:peptide ABC transporter substrate-binding protein [Frigoribacterium faeni]|uniref:Peptide ABC transporter substrate-binding protein n=2 Tax=Frigoribacterium faeni TaxID=145483 RepID=A0ABQ0UMC8_9MICO|nr:ABC transporter substrate-binding protein [Microbacterium flavescens]GEK82644.1 peptide ABC transporter substrate-binding protein [Frigoribacterium faeni]
MAMKHTSRPRALWRAAAAATAAALLLAGCSIQIRSQPDPSIGADTMLINADKGNPQFERNFNPFLTNKRTASTWIYEPLLEINPLDGEITPWLASRTDLPDARTIDMTIRDGVEWSDGTPMTPADVVYTFDLIKANPTLDLKGAWQHIDTIEQQGDHVVFHLQTDDVPAMEIIGQTTIVPEHLWSTVDDPTTFRNPDPVGTGPFTLGNYSPQQYSMDRNPSYWQAEKIEIEHLILPATNNQLDTVTRGYDWSYSFISDVEGTWGAASPDNRFWFPPGGVIGLVPNLTKAPFDDVNVRRGIALALDRGPIAESATEGYLEPAGQTGLILPNQEDDLDPSIPNDGILEQDVDGALAAFAEAGYTQQGDRMVGPDGQQLRITILTANGYTDWLRAVQEVRGQLGAIGIDVQIQAPQPAGYQSAIANGEFDMAMGGMGNGNVYQAFNNLLNSEFATPVGETTAANFERFSDPEVDQLLDDWKATTDPEQQKRFGYELQNVVYDQLPVIGLYYGGLWGLFNDSKFTGWPSAENPYMAPQNYDQAPLLIFTKLKRVSNEGDDK